MVINWVFKYHYEFMYLNVIDMLQSTAIIIFIDVQNGPILGSLFLALRYFDMILLFL